MIISVDDWLGKFLTSIGAAKSLEPKQAEIPKKIPATNLWGQLIEAIKASDMPDGQKAACLAQAMLESGRGSSRVFAECNGNAWGIKFRDTLKDIAKPRRVPVTSEVEGWAEFAEFTNPIDAVKGWRLFLTRPYYSGWEPLVNDSEAFIRHIGKAWCPAAGYAEKVIALLPEARQILGIIVSEKGKTIGLNAGHAGTSGASGKNNAIQEHIENAVQVEVVKAILERAGHTVKVLNQNMFNGDLLATGKAAKGCDAFVAMHQNASNGVEHGAEVLVGSNATKASQELGAKISAAMSKAQGIADRGINTKSVSVISGAQSVGVPVVLLTESQFIDDETDPVAARKKTTAGGEAIANALVEWFK